MTDSYHAVTTTPASSAQSDKTFTIDYKVTEIPTRYKRIKQISKLDAQIVYDIWVMDDATFNSNLIGLDNSLQGYYSPQRATLTRNKDGRRILRFDPKTDADKEVTLYAEIGIDESTYDSDAVTATIPLDISYERVIREYVKHYVYDWLKNDERSVLHYGKFQMWLNEQKNNLMSVPTYRKVSAW